MNFQFSMPIFVDPSTGQTIIHSSRGTSKSIYILKNLSQWNSFYIAYIIPPLINVYGKIFSIGELIRSGYASFINTGIGMTGNRDFGTFFRPGPRK